MAKLNRCPRCSDRRIEDRRYCPNCAFDYADSSGSGAGASDPSERKNLDITRGMPRGETGVAPGARRILDPELIRAAPDLAVEDVDDEDIPLEVPRRSGRVRTRLGGCLGALAALSILAIGLPVLARLNS
jgi:hypothetical protein